MSNTNQSITIMDFINLAAKEGVSLKIIPLNSFSGLTVKGAALIRLENRYHIRSEISLDAYDIEKGYIPIDRLLTNSLKSIGIDLEDE